MVAVVRPGGIVLLQDYPNEAENEVYSGPAPMQPRLGRRRLHLVAAGYQVVALRARIESGELAPGDMLPSITRISQEWGVAKITAAKALKELRSEGLTRSVPGWGTFVAGPDTD
jgi:hypothetical protein